MKPQHPAASVPPSQSESPSPSPNTYSASPRRTAPSAAIRSSKPRTVARAKKAFRYASWAVPCTTATVRPSSARGFGSGWPLSARAAKRKYGKVTEKRRRSAGVIGIAAAMTSPRASDRASASVSKRRAWMVQVMPRRSQAARASSTEKPVGAPSGPTKCSGGKSSSVRKRTVRRPERSGRSCRARGSHRFGIATSWATTGAAAASPATHPSRNRTIRLKFMARRRRAILTVAGHLLLFWTSRPRELSFLTIQGQAIGTVAAANPVLPIEIAFLQNHGVGADLLRRAAEAARRSGSFADEALLKLGLVDEAFFYQALAAEIELPFLGSDVPVGPAARFPYSLRLGLAPLAATVSRLRPSARKSFGSSKPPGASPTGS